MATPAQVVPELSQLANLDLQVAFNKDSSNTGPRCVWVGGWGREDVLCRGGSETGLMGLGWASGRGRVEWHCGAARWGRVHFSIVICEWLLIGSSAPTATHPNGPVDSRSDWIRIAKILDANRLKYDAFLVRYISPEQLLCCSLPPSILVFFLL